MNNALNIAKAAVSIVTSTGVGVIVGNAIKASTPDNLTKFQKVSTTVGSIVLTSMVAGAASNYAGEQIEQTVTQLKTLKTALPKND